MSCALPKVVQKWFMKLLCKKKRTSLLLSNTYYTAGTGCKPTVLNSPCFWSRSSSFTRTSDRSFANLSLANCRQRSTTLKAEKLHQSERTGINSLIPKSDKHLLSCYSINTLLHRQEKEIRLKISH